jgi:hypothetical protein
MPLVGQKVSQILPIYLGLIERNLLSNFSVQFRVIFCVQSYFFEYRDQRHPSTSRITLPIRSPVLSSRSLKTITINGLSSQKLILPSLHLCFLPANFPSSHDPIGLLWLMIGFSIIDRVCQILRSLSVFRKTAPAAVMKRESPIGAKSR